MANNNINITNEEFPTTYSGTDIRVIAYLDKALKDFGEIKALEDEYESIDKSIEDQFQRNEIINEANFSKLKNIQIEKDNKQKEIDEFKLNHFFELGTISTISYSTFREKKAVRTLGRSEAKAYTRGPRTIAGTMVFTVFNHFELDRLIGDSGDIALLDQLPLFNIMLVFSNEYGHISLMHLKDVDFASEGQSHSINNLTIDKSLNFYCKNYLPLRPYGGRWSSVDQMFKKGNNFAEKVLDELYRERGYTINKPEKTFKNILESIQNDRNITPEMKETLRRTRRTTI